MDSHTIEPTQQGEHSDQHAGPGILPLAIAALTDPEARWRFAESPWIAGIIRREVSKRARNFHDAQDLRSELRILIYETFASEGPEGRGVLCFETEGQTVAYWDKKIRRLAAQAMRITGNARFVRGELITRETPSGSRDDIDRMIAASKSPERIVRPIDAVKPAEDESRGRYRMDLIRRFLAEYADQQAVRKFLQKVLGGGARGARGARAIAEDLEIARWDRASAACHRVYADLLAFLFEQGETPVFGTIGAYVEVGRVSAVVYRRGIVVDSWTLRTTDYSGFRKVARRIRKSLDRGVARVIVGRPGGMSDEEVVLRHACWGRGVPCEVVEADEVAERGPMQEAAGRPLNPGERMALAVALAGGEEEWPGRGGETWS